MKVVEYSTIFITLSVKIAAKGITGIYVQESFWFSFFYTELDKFIIFPKLDNYSWYRFGNYCQ